MSTELESVLANAARRVPGMVGVIAHDGPPGIRAGADNSALIARLRDHWRARYPEAGPHYLALRCWGLLIWQPIYLGVIAAHEARGVPDLSRLSAPWRDDGFLAGYHISRHALRHGVFHARMDDVAGQLRALCAGLLAELSSVVHISTKAAQCMQADIVLNALLTLRPDDREKSNAQAQCRAAQWLARLGLSGRSSYFECGAPGRPLLAVDRQVCCHYFRKRDGDYCSTCPKLEMHERIIRLHAEQVQAA
ncbi:Putative iron reductase in siderophore [Alcaligin] cluster [plant metagenome]|uniref:Iron reductase in siderophore [Alcaligin] cluster n=1 Tax=plant metagenome TaxID=1297885 RepID=A0A484QB88_9ZZZZ